MRTWRYIYTTMNNLTPISKSFIFLGLSILLFSACKEAIFREVPCRAFAEQEDLQWMVGNKKDTLSFLTSNKTLHHFTVAAKDIIHRKKYVSDSGCGCNDIWEVLYTEGTDSLVVVFFTKYVENKPATKYEDVAAVFNHTTSYFNETKRTVLSNYTIDSTSFTEVYQYANTYTGANQVKAIYLIKHVGIAQMEMTNGDIWTNTRLNTKKTVDKSSFDYQENTCQ